jgi:hypothetical protein
VRRYLGKGGELRKWKKHKIAVFFIKRVQRLPT